MVPTIVVHGLLDARVALRSGRSVCLLSAPGAGRRAGAGWWRAMVAAARSEATPGQNVTDVLDCDAAPGVAMAALRQGQRTLVLDAACPGFAAVVAAAQSLNATVLGRRPDAVAVLDQIGEVAHHTGPAASARQVTDRNV